MKIASGSICYTRRFEMDNLLALIPALPLAGALLLILAGNRISKGTVAFVGVGSICLSALVALIIGYKFLANTPPTGTISQTLWIWFEVADFKPAITLYLDALSL